MFQKHNKIADISNFNSSIAFILKYIAEPWLFADYLDFLSNTNTKLQVTLRLQTRINCRNTQNIAETHSDTFRSLRRISTHSDAFKTNLLEILDSMDEIDLLEH